MKKVILLLILFMSGFGLIAVDLPEPIQGVDEISVSVEIDTVEVLDLCVEQFALRVTMPQLIKGSYTEYNQSFYCSKLIKFKADNKCLYIEGIPIDADVNYIITHQTDLNTYFLETEGNRVSQI